MASQQLKLELFIKNFGEDKIAALCVARSIFAVSVLLLPEFRVDFAFNWHFQSALVIFFLLFSMAIMQIVIPNNRSE